MTHNVKSRNEILSRLGCDECEVSELMDAIFPFSDETRTRVLLDRVDSRNHHGETLPADYSVRFEAVNGRDLPMVHPQQIPALIDALTLMHREWLLDLDGS